jgi:hypothetical protein
MTRPDLHRQSQRHPPSANSESQDNPLSSASSEPPILTPPHLRSDSDGVWREWWESIDQVLGSESYGAPRVFDLFTMLAITLAFACLFAVLRLAEPLMPGELDEVAICLGCFVTGIAIAQIALWGGKKPRIASLVAGPICWFLILAGLNLPYASQWRNSWFYLGGLCSSVLGIPAGYLGGALVAGVFLIADFFRQRFLHAMPSQPADNDDAIFSDSAPQENGNR